MKPAPLGTGVPAELRKVINTLPHQRPRPAVPAYRGREGWRWHRVRYGNGLHLAWSWVPWAAALVGTARACLRGLVSKGYWGRKPALPAEVIPLISYGWVLEAEFLEGRQQVVFSWNGERRDRQDNFDIYIKLIGTSAILRLTSDPAEDRSPAFSPDGREVGFIRTANNRHFFITVPAIGGVEKNVAEIPPTGRFELAARR